jgi:hypothetical protein
LCRPAVHVEVLAEYTVGALRGVPTWWLGNGTPLPAWEMAATFERLTTPALPAGLGIGTATPIVEQPT